MNAHTEVPEANEIIATAEVLMRSRVVVENISLRGQVKASELVREIIGRVENDDNTAYAVRLAVPSNIPGAVNIKSYSKSGKNLDGRRFSTHPVPDGNFSLWLYTKATGQACVGVFTSQSFADTIGSLWTSGVIELEFPK